MSALLQDPLVLTAGGMFIFVLSLLFAFGDDDGGKLGKRSNRLRERLTTVATATDLQLRREAGDKGFLDRLVHRLTPQPEQLRRRLARTGHQIGLGSYGLACLVVAVLAGGTAVMLRLTPLLALPVGLLVGLWIPYLVVGFLAGLRMKRFTNLLPEAISLMVRSIKSGLPIAEAFQIIGRELPDPIGVEFRRLCEAIRIGQPIDQALWDTAARVGVPEMKFLVVTLSVQRETGGNLAETLENLDNILRRRRQMRLKVKALSSEARASAMIIGALPFIMMGVLSVADAGYLSVLFNDHLGNMLLAAGGTSMTFGVGVMAKMVRFDI
ncbi:MAG TPA: type II secretion system F family protein [Stellaceae bacterium]|nr:type II secretion system F family protein [Stellaceae bacterium]